MSQYVTITIPDPGKAIEGHELLVQIGMEVNGLVEYIPIGIFLRLENHPEMKNRLSLQLMTG